MHVILIRNLNPFFENSADANRFAGIIKGLLASGIKVTQVVTSGYNDANEYRKKGYNFSDSNFKVYYTRHILNSNIWLKRFNKYVLRRLTHALSLSRLKKLMCTDCDYLWLTNNQEILAAFNSCSNKIKSKTIIELNEFNDIYKEKGATGNKLQQQYAIESEKVFLEAVGKIDNFVIMTRTLVKHYRAMAKSEARFLHMPMTVDISRFIDFDAEVLYKKPYIAYAGTFNNTKDGTDILIKSFATIASTFPDLNLYLAGFYHYDMEKQKELIKELGLQNRITYLGVLNKEQIPPYLINASLAVLPRPDSHQAQGGFPTKLGEYLATGNPVCVTSVGEIPNYLVDNESAFLATPGSVESFTDALRRALSDEENAKNIGLAGQNVAKRNFSLDVQIRNLVNFLDSK